MEITAYYKGIENYVIIDSTHGLFIEIKRENNCIKVVISRIYEIKFADWTESVVSPEVGIINIINDLEIQNIVKFNHM